MCFTWRSVVLQYELLSMVRWLRISLSNHWEEGRPRDDLGTKCPFFRMGPLRPANIRGAGLCFCPERGHCKLFDAEAAFFLQSLNFRIKFPDRSGCPVGSREGYHLLIQSAHF